MSSWSTFVLVYLLIAVLLALGAAAWVIFGPGRPRDVEDQVLREALEPRPPWLR